MKTFLPILIILALAAMVACTPKIPASKTHPEWALDAVIYELNTRQFTPEGTFEAAARELPRLRDLGVGIVWLMPIQPIGLLERKGELGSYYAIRDYCATNPEFGTMADLQAFVEQAHGLGMKVIMDWVANHTSPDAVWIDNPGWHLRDADGKTIGPYDWTDVAKLDYSNRDMRAAMIEAMRFWITQADIDGFRCDVAFEVPTDFWNTAVDSLTALKSDLFMLAEAEVPEHQEHAFDAYYGWEYYNLTNRIAASTADADTLRAFLREHEGRFPAGIPMLFTSNHDENSWNGTEFERLGEAAPLFAVMSYILPGIPLIYNGQEVGLERRLEFFVKDSVGSYAPNQWTDIYHGLNELRRHNKALHSLPAGGKLEELTTDNPDLFAVKREVEGSRVIALMNLSPEPLTAVVNDKRYAGEFIAFDGGGEVTLTPGASVELPAWGFAIYY